MPSYSYKVVPFAGQAKASQLGKISAHLQGAINSEAVDGWEFYQLASVNIEAAPGCIASLLGATTATVQLDQLIFRRLA